LPHDDNRRETPAGIIAIPAKNEADRIAACLAALVMQRDHRGEPIAAGKIEIVVFVNNSDDATAAIAGQLASVSPHPIIVVEETLGPDKSSAGWARKRAMDIAADRLANMAAAPAFLLTTDADSRASPTWVAATLAAFEQGADCVAGTIDADPSEIVALGTAFLTRSRLEDRYIRQVNEINASCDPIAHDPWPNHRVSSGASLAVTLDAYRAIGGLPPVALGEDIALTRTLEQAGFKVRHALDVSVVTSCRFDGRAKGGAADTMRYRHEVASAPCDDDIEPAFAALKRAILRARVRRLDRGELHEVSWVHRLGLNAEQIQLLASLHRDSTFAEFWLAIEQISPVFAKRRPLGPADLPREIRRADLILKALRPGLPVKRIGAPVDRFDPAQSFATDIST
jgi:GT2 family glycosyltransferase